MANDGATPGTVGGSLGKVLSFAAVVHRSDFGICLCLGVVLQQSVDARAADATCGFSLSLCGARGRSA
jgi:hypothetical protein